MPHIRWARPRTALSCGEMPSGGWAPVEGRTLHWSTVTALQCVLLCSCVCHRGYAAPPPARPPASIVDALTVGGQAPLEYLYVDDTNGGKGTHFKFSFDEIVEMVKQAEAMKVFVASAGVPPPPVQAAGNKGTRITDLWLIHALEQHPIVDMNVAVFGSMSPWYESIALAMGAKSVTVIEYNQLTYDHPAITTLQPHQLPGDLVFDAVLSISSFDHDGLGRYGDPINPDADLEAMQNAQRLLRPGHKMFLTVPIGPDVVVWNLHRRYGAVRLPLLLRGWSQVAVVGWREELLTTEASWLKTYEPVFVLENGNRDEL